MRGLGVNFYMMKNVCDAILGGKIVWGNNSVDKIDL